LNPNKNMYPPKKLESMKNMQKTRREDETYCLGIESSADDFGVGIATFNGKILANKYESYIPAEGGIHPREAARHHSEIADRVLELP
jgi:hypothetical protein